MLGTFHGVVTAGKDPDLRYTPSGAAVVNVRVVTSARKKNEATGQWEDDPDKTSWFDLSAWNQLAEHIAESVVKGTSLVVIGKMLIREWTDDQGNKRLSPTISADEVGASLRFATAKITKSERTGGGQQQPAGGQTDPWSTAPAQTDEPPF